ncbi:MAG: TraR/DksA C4-type zinc finger protein [Phycisphaerales bacterium]
MDEFRSSLLAKRREIIGDVNGMESKRAHTEASGDLSCMPIHMADIGTDNYEQEFSMSLMDSEIKMLGEIDDALKRIDEGTYGICLGSGNPIPKVRLKAKPWARYSVEYARMVENGELPSEKTA